MQTSLGWVLVSAGTEENPERLSMFISTEESQMINENLKRFWEIENIDEKIQTNPFTEQENEALMLFEKGIRYEEAIGRYEVRLPFIEGSKIPNNREIAEGRFRKNQYRFKKEQKLGTNFRQSMNEYIEKGFAEKVVETQEPENCYYIPTHIVVNENKTTTKVRLVFDASSKGKEMKSLNDVLHKGPILQPNMNSIIIKFRTHNIAINADIRKMYLMILMNAQDKDMLRFFWEDNENGMATYRNNVLPFGLRCSPFLAIATVHHHLRKYQEDYPQIVTELKENMYMDDLLTGAKTEEEATKLYKEACMIMKEAGMDLVKWKTNNATLYEMFKRDGVESVDEPKIIEIEKEEQNISNSKILGIQWNSGKDEFKFKSVDEEIDKNRATKRSILKIAPKLYDPMGWLSPYIVRVKILFQSLWEHGLEWDENIPENLLNKWRNWVDEMKYIDRISIPRKYSSLSSVVSRYELHIFGDASEMAYGAACYLKSYDSNNKSCTALVYSKSKVAPVKKITLPRLELLAAEIAAKMSNYVRESLNLENLQIFLWTDSLITLHWIKANTRQWKTFVSNRVQNIKRYSEPENWNWCPGESNPADLVSRGMKLKDLGESELWLNGPKWMKKDKEFYPKKDIGEETNEVLREKREHAVVCLIQNGVHSKTENRTRNVVNPIDYSKMSKLFRITAYILRFIYNLSHKMCERRSGSLSKVDLQEAENYWLKQIQMEHFFDEIELLKKGKHVNNNSRLIHLAPYYDDESGLIKMRGRVQYADLSEDEKHPVILPDKSYIVKLIVEDRHRKQIHGGINQTLIAVREQFWILRARALVRRIVKSCIICRMYSPKRIQVSMAPLPKDRITRAFPFEITGVDYTGPVYVERGNNTKKSYILLFTCATIRAVHLELVEDMTSEAFLRAFRRFASRRGYPSTVYSDNALSFKKANKTLEKCHEIMNGAKFKNYLTENEIEWKFIPERAPWWGGFYERLMASIKLPLKKLIGRTKLTSDEFYTVLTEVEAMVNSRPLTFISDEPQETSYITPASFLIGRPITNIPIRTSKGKDPGGLSSKEINRCLISQNRMLESIWKMWKEDYIRQLGRVPNDLKEDNALKVGELVMVTDHNSPRCKWEVGLIESVKEGRDGKIRQCKVRTAKRGTLTRPVQHVARLEMESMEEYQKYSLTSLNGGECQILPGSIE